MENVSRTWESTSFFEPQFEQALAVNQPPENTIKGSTFPAETDPGILTDVGNIRIFEYIKNPKTGRRKGVMIAFVEPYSQEVLVGYSIFNEKKEWHCGKEFKLSLAFQIAIDRAYDSQDEFDEDWPHELTQYEWELELIGNNSIMSHIPPCIQKQWRRFIGYRCERFFSTIRQEKEYSLSLFAEEVLDILESLDVNEDVKSISTQEEINQIADEVLL